MLFFCFVVVFFVTLLTSSLSKIPLRMSDRLCSESSCVVANVTTSSNVISSDLVKSCFYVISFLKPNMNWSCRRIFESMSNLQFAARQQSSARN